MTREMHMGAARAGLSVAVDVRLVRAEYIRISRTTQPTGLRSAILAIYSRVRGLPKSVDFPSFSVFACIYVFSEVSHICTTREGCLAYKHCATKNNFKQINSF